MYIPSVSSLSICFNNVQVLAGMCVCVSQKKRDKGREGGQKRRERRWEEGRERKENIENREGEEKDSGV